MARAGGDPSFDQYLEEVRRHPLLGPEEERELARAVQSHDWGAWEARDRMIRSNLRLVISIAKRYQNRGLALADLVADGNIGLVHAVEKFDPEMETRFSTYATWWIKQAIRRSIMNTAKTVRIPTYMAEELNRWRAHARALAKKTGRDPTREEMVEAMKPAASRERFLVRLFEHTRSGGDTVSLDVLFDSIEALVDPRAARPDEIEFGHVEKERLVAALGDMAEREAEVLRARFGLNAEAQTYTLRQIAERMGISRERVRQIEKKALQDLRDQLRAGQRGRDA